jgi:hypothetical protein
VLGIRNIDSTFKNYNTNFSCILFFFAFGHVTSLSSFISGDKHRFLQ